MGETTTYRTPPPYHPLDVALSSTSGLRHRVIASELALIELAILYRRQSQLIDDVRNTFRKKRRHGTDFTNDDSKPYRDVREPDISDSLTLVNESSRLNDDEPPSTSSCPSSEIQYRLVKDLYRLPVSVGGVTASYPSPLHAVLAQHSNLRPSLTADSADSSSEEINTIDHHASLTADELKIPPSGTEYTADFNVRDNDSVSSRPEMESHTAVVCSLPLSTLGFERRNIVDRRLVSITRSTSAASVSSSEGYCSGTESDGVIDATFRSSIYGEHSRIRHSEIFTRQSIEDDHVTASVAVTRLLSALTDGEMICGTQWTTPRYNREGKHRRRLCKTNRKLSPLASAGDENDVFVMSSSNKFQTVRLNI